MNLKSFRQAVDNCPDEITSCLGDLSDLYAYVGLPIESSFSQQEASKELYKKISAAFTSGHLLVWRRARELRDELIQRHVIDGETLDPYFSVLDVLLDASRSQPQVAGDIQGNWNDAIRHARDHVRINDWSAGVPRERVHARSFEVAKAAKRLQERGFKLLRHGHFISMEPESETRLIEVLERLVTEMGGLNVARRIFKQITPLYDAAQERYHLVRRVQPSGGGSPDIPFGYLLHLAAKHFLGVGPMKNTDENWVELCRLALDYAALLDVQEYTPSVWHSMDAVSLLPYLQELAVSDTLFRIPQIRGSDVEKIARGILPNFDFDEKRGSGWTLNDVLAGITAILDLSRQVRGPCWFDVPKLVEACNGLSGKIISAVLDEVLSHPKTGANQKFSNPKDEPKDKETGQTFYSYPLLSSDRKTYWLLDRSMCAAACLESIMTVLRSSDKDFDGNLGIPIEAFLRAEFSAHSIPTLTGKYIADGEDGECDIVIGTAKAVIFLEIKKKPLTRRAQAGSDAHVMLDLANSLLAAQVQAGWHEIRLRKHGYLELDDNGTKSRLELNGREIERIAVSLMQFGSFQDRILLKQFLEGTLHADFNVNDASMKKKFSDFNGLLAELRQQVNILHAGQTELKQPFFHCWFLSVPQLLVLLDDVGGVEDFKQALWMTRHFVTGSSDFYFDNAYRKKLAASAPAVTPASSI